MSAKKLLTITISAVAVFAAYFGVRVIFAAPTCDPSGVCSVLTTDGSGNFGIGANSDGVSSLFIKTVDHSASYNGLKIVSNNGVDPVFIVRNDGVITMASGTAFADAGLVFPDGSKQVMAFTGAASSISAGNVSAGSFGSNLGGGVYSFPAALAVGATTTTGLPTNGLYVVGNVGIGTSAPEYQLNLYGASNKLGLTYSTTLEYGAIGAELNVDSEGNLYIKATKRGPSILARNILLADNGGKVGIATTTPAYPLSVAGTIQSSTGGFRFPDGTTQTTAATAGTNYFALSGTSLYPTSTAYNFGIGTTTPAFPLHVIGNGKFTGNLNAATGYSIENSGYNYGSGAHNFYRPYMTLAQGLAAAGELSSAKSLFINIDADNNDTTSTVVFGNNANGSSASQIMVIQENGNVGIGTGTAYAKLQINGGDIYILNNGNNPRFLLADSTSGGEWAGMRWLSASDILQIGTDTGGYVMHFTETGNIGIGTTTPATALSVVGQLSMNNNKILGLATPTLTTDAATKAYVDSVAGGSTNYFTISGDNLYPTSTAYKLGIGTSTPAAKLTLSNNVATDYLDNFSEYQILMHTGSSALMSYGLGIKGSTMVFNSGAGAYSFDRGGSANTMTLSTAGNVGIATTTPTYPLTVAGVIHSSTGGYRFPDGTTQTSAGATYAGTGSWLGVNYFQVTAGSGIYLRNGGGAPLQAFSNDGGGAYMSFHRGGAYAVNMGLDPDGSFAIGGWSDGTVNRIKVETTGNTTFGSTGTAKINVGTIDPPYTINGEQYATYLPGMIGQKEETTGEILITCPLRQSLSEASNVQLVTCKTAIDFNKQEKGSDLWLFSKTTNLTKQMDKMTVLLTPSFDGKVWYEKDVKNNVLNIFSIPASDHSLSTNLSISYRLTAPRFDSEKWLNTRNDSGVDGFILNY